MQKEACTVRRQSDKLQKDLRRLEDRKSELETQVTGLKAESKESDHQATQEAKKSAMAVRKVDKLTKERDTFQRSLVKSLGETIIIILVC